VGTTLDAVFFLELPLAMLTHRRPGPAALVRPANSSRKRAGEKAGRRAAADRPQTDQIVRGR